MGRVGIMVKNWTKPYGHEEPELWGLIGPTITLRDTVRELGNGPIVSSPETTWFVTTVFGHPSKPVAFGAVDWKDPVTPRLKHAFVLPEFRNRGEYLHLLDARIDWCEQMLGAEAITARCTPASLHALESRGFKVIREVGKYKELRR